MTGGTHTADGSAAALSSFITVTGERFRQVDIKANSGNAASIYIGGSDVTSAGANAWVELDPGATWGARTESGDRLSFDLDSTYVVGTASDLAHFALL